MEQVTHTFTRLDQMTANKLNENFREVMRAAAEGGVLANLDGGFPYSEYGSFTDIDGGDA